MKKHTLIIGIIGVLLLIQPINAQTWEKTKRLTWTSEGSWGAAIAVDSNNHIHVVWHDNTPGNPEIYYKKSTNGGASWTTKRLTWNLGNSREPNIAIDSNNHIHVVWHDETPGNLEIYYMVSTNGGASWTSKRLTWTSTDSRLPAIAVDSNNHIHVVWYDSVTGNSEIFYKKSTNGGASWTTKRLTWTFSSATGPSIAIDSNDNIHVVWHGGPIGNVEIHYKKSTDGGINWTTKQLTWTANSSYYPSLAVDFNNYIHVVWYESAPGNSEIYYKKSTNGGINWTTKQLTWTADSSYNPAIASDSHNRIHVVWMDDTPGNKEILYKRSTDGGTSWIFKRLTWNSGSSGGPAIFVGLNNHIHVVWEDITPGNYEIFYRKGIQ